MRRVLLAVVVVVLLAAVPLPASAGGSGTEVLNAVLSNQAYQVAMPNPCSGAAGLTTFRYQSDIHVTAQADGTFWAHFVYVGSYGFQPFDASQPSYAGSFDFWSGVNFNGPNLTNGDVFTVRATGSDGSTLFFHEVVHETLLLDAAPAALGISFDKATCG
jgi:hypothetical protein